MRIHPTKTGQIPLSQIPRFQQQNPNEQLNVMMPFLAQMMRMAMGGKQSESPIEMLGPNCSSGSSMDIQGLAQRMLADSQLQVPNLPPQMPMLRYTEPTSADDVPTTNRSQQQLAPPPKPRQQQLVRVRSAIGGAAFEPSASTSAGGMHPDPWAETRPQETESLPPKRPTVDEACTAVLKAIQARNVMKKDKALPPLTFYKFVFVNLSPTLAPNLGSCHAYM